MNNEVAKFVLSAYRPVGRGATDPLFVEPLAQSRSDPELRAWLKTQLAFDSAVTARLRELRPPPGLRDMILAGVRVSRREDARCRRWLWFGAAAVVMISTSVLIIVHRSGAVRPELTDLRRFALLDTAHAGREHIASIPTMRNFEARLTEIHFRNGIDLDFDLAALRANGCRTVMVAGREVFEICFGRDRQFHLYLAKRGAFSIARAGEPQFTTQGRLSAATWQDSQFAFALVTTEGVDVLRQRR